GRAVRAGGVGGHLHEDGQALVGDGRRGRPLGQEGADRLVHAVGRGADVYPALVPLQGAHVTLVEQGIGANLDVVGTGGGIGDYAVGNDHPHRVVAEHGGQAPLQHVHRLVRAQGLGLVGQVAARVDVVQVVGEHQA